MANVCSWCGACTENEFDTPAGIVCEECWEKVQSAECATLVRPWKPWSAAKEYKHEPMKRTDRF